MTEKKYTGFCKVYKDIKDRDMDTIFNPRGASKKEPVEEEECEDFDEDFEETFDDDFEDDDFDDSEDE